jgi:chromosome partitioning protein
MKTIVITSQKGGSGKTTLAAHLAVEAEQRGDGPAWLVDTDKQGTLSLWHEHRPTETPQRLDAPFAQLSGALRLLANKGAAWCFIDTAPTISDQSARILELADLVVVPVRPSPADLWAVAETVALVKEARKPFLFVITQAKAQATITAQAVAALSHHGRVAQTFIADRVPYAAAMTGGQTAAELSPKSAAAHEVAALWIDVKKCFHEKLKTTHRAKAHAHG